MPEPINQNFNGRAAEGAQQQPNENFIPSGLSQVTCERWIDACEKSVADQNIRQEINQIGQTIRRQEDTYNRTFVAQTRAFEQGQRIGLYPDMTVDQFVGNTQQNRQQARDQSVREATELFDRTETPRQVLYDKFHGVELTQKFNRSRPTVKEKFNDKSHTR